MTSTDYFVVLPFLPSLLHSASLHCICTFCAKETQPGCNTEKPNKTGMKSERVTPEKGKPCTRTRNMHSFTVGQIVAVEFFFFGIASVSFRGYRAFIQMDATTTTTTKTEKQNTVKVEGECAGKGRRQTAVQSEPSF